MLHIGHRFLLELFREGGARLGQARIDPDFEPAREWSFFLGLQDEKLSPEAACRPASVIPLWHDGLGEPYVRGFRVEIGADSSMPFSVEFDTEYFRPLAFRASSEFVQEGLLEAAGTFQYVACAFPEPPKAAARSFFARELPAPLPIREGALADFLPRSSPDHTFSEPSLAMPVFLPSHVLEETEELASRAGENETGGILIGHLCRDAERRLLFVEVTAQVSARHVRADSESLTFTAQTWTDVRAVLELRRSAELMVGWWHSHPVRLWCAKCPIERQKICRLSRDFLSEQDRRLHRTIFPRAYSVALVINDTAFGPMTHSLFSWDRGRIVSRPFHVIGTAPKSGRRDETEPFAIPSRDCRGGSHGS
jgi:proteasome lid subunit RPN8/RPN11